MNKINIRPNDEKRFYGICKFNIEDSEIKRIKKDVIGLSLSSGKTSDSSYRDRRKVMLCRMSPEGITGEIIKNLIPTINQEFGYKICSIQDIQYIKYKKGDRYDWHMDIDDNDGAFRKISISILLNDGFTGGNLEFFHEGETINSQINKNELIAFTSFINHRVTPVASGEREVIVAWLKGDAWR
jgi:predicted 2-oxoglutarate/Fe(II)-dependent dioxygenase YbiX